MNLAAPLAQHVRAHGLGLTFGAETGFLLSRDPDTVRAPDIAFVRTESLPSDGVPQGFIPGAPDLAVEIVSPGDTVYEVDEKTAVWLAAGAETVWIVNPRRRSVTIHHKSGGTRVLGENEELSGEPTVPGFSLPVRAIFL